MFSVQHLCRFPRLLHLHLLRGSLQGGQEAVEVLVSVVTVSAENGPTTIQPSQSRLAPQNPVPSQSRLAPQNPVPSQSRLAPQNPVPSQSKLAPQNPVPSQSRLAPQNPVPSSAIYQMSTLNRSQNRSSAVPPLASPEEAAPHDHFNDVQGGELEHASLRRKGL